MESRKVQRTTTVIVRASLTILLVGAAVLKAVALISEADVPSFAMPRAQATAYGPLVAAIIGAECAAGIGLWTRWSGRAAAGTLILALLFALGFLLDTILEPGAVGCGCLGSVRVPPWSRACMIAGVALAAWLLMVRDRGYRAGARRPSAP